MSILRSIVSSLLRLRSLVLSSPIGESLTTWDLIIPRIEFAYNSSTNHTTSMSPFEITHGLSRRFFKR
ncbi:unnamed protein product [Spirodela intermedia]|uniref:Uncharacterized protein n=1 Tax=Spirodela intermedia TaxID=51605 RepID=A0ABN7E945_SPIIN|nr:unnamed protein product [Spirodela intermedia]